MISFMRNLSPTVKIVLIFIFFATATATLSLSIQRLLGDHGANDPHEDSTVHDSILKITNSDDPFQKANISTIKGRILNAIYKRHYDETGKIERRAKIDGSIHRSNKNYNFKIVFQPSNLHYTVKLTVINLEQFNYTIDIQKG
jgi:hypothetical protein